MSQAKRWLPLASALAGFLALGGCATAPTPGDAMRQRAVRDLQGLQVALKQARQAPYQTVRYNPVSCECPAFEVLVYDAVAGHPRWVRCALVEGSTDQPALPHLFSTARDDLMAERLATYALVGNLDTDLEAGCDNGAPSVTLVVEAVRPSGPNAPLLDDD